MRPCLPCEICDVESACICVFVTVRHALCDSSLSYLCLSRGNLVPAEKRFERVTCVGVPFEACCFIDVPVAIIMERCRSDSARAVSRRLCKPAFGEQAEHARGLYGHPNILYVY